ncbi:MAG: sulfurtransferase [Lacisediminihabitans sp.]
MTSPFVSVRELAALLERPEAKRPADRRPVVLDASFLLHKPEFDGDYRTDSGRPRWLAAHIPGSQHVDISTQFSDPSAPTHYAHAGARSIARELATLGVSPTTPVVVYDGTATIWAARLWYLLNWIGVDVRVLDGGLAAWQAAGHPVDAGETVAPTPVEEWDPGAVREAWVTRDELLSRSETDARPLVCGLPASNFSGADPSRYARRGHIPGSVNVSSRDLFAADGTVKGESELREAYVTQGVTGDEEVLLYCGGGVSASANALTLAELGVTAVRIYDGSLEEWSGDPSLPLELG